MEIVTASNQWAKRPDDERFESLTALGAYCRYQREKSRSYVVSSRKVKAVPDTDAPISGLQIVGPNGHGYVPTHWSFGQLSNLAGAPAGYLRNLPAPIAADCINYGLHFKRDVQEIGCLLRANGSNVFAAATGPNYGRVWNSEIADLLVEKFHGTQWKVPGEFGQAVNVTKANTTLYASDREMFVFLADEERRITIPNRRDGSSGEMARGFLVWNSEVGSQTLGAAFFLFDYVCCNRIIWGAEQFKEVRIRHTSGAPDRWLEQIVPVLTEYAESSPKPVQETIELAMKRRIDRDVSEFLAERFGKNLVPAIEQAHEVEEGRPIETIWDAVTAVTAYAKLIPHQDDRVDIERKAGMLLAA